MLTPIEFFYLTKELKILEKMYLKRIYQEDHFVMEFKEGQRRFFLIIGKNFCYLDNKVPERLIEGGFSKFILSKLKSRKLTEIKQQDFNKALILDFGNLELILEFIGKGNIILLENKKIIGALHLREFKDRKIKIGETYKSLDSLEIKKYLDSKDINSVRRFHLGKFYLKELEIKHNLNELLNQKASPTIYFDEDKKIFLSPFPLPSLNKLDFKKKETLSEAIKEFFAEKKKSKNEVIKESHKKNLEKYALEREEFKTKADLLLRYRDIVTSVIENFKNSGELCSPSKKYTESSGLIEFELEGKKIEVELNRDIKSQIDQLYQKSKKAKEKIKRIKKLPEIKLKSKTRSFSKEEGKNWYAQFRYFYTSDGFLVIAGKDAQTNEKIIKKHCKKRDIILHAHLPGSPFGVIKSEGREISDNAKKEAANFVACYSRFWISKLGLADIYWINPDQVSKSVKGSLKAGSFMIYGKRNFIRVELKLSIGIDKDFMIIKGPEEAVKKYARYYLVVIPGNKSGKELGTSIKKALIEKSKKEDIANIIKINPEEFLKVVPYGKGEIYRE